MLHLSELSISTYCHSGFIADTALTESYEQAHRSRHGTELQNLDYCMKKQTDDITNTVNK